MRERRRFLLNGVELSVKSASTVWRDILSPGQAARIDDGKEELVDSRGVLLHLDSRIVADLPRVQSAKDKEPRLPLTVETRRVSMPDSWLGNFPGLANVGFLFVVSADENVELFRRIIRQLRAHGFTAIGFRHVEEAVSAIKSRKRFLRGMTAFGMVPDEASVDAVVQWFSEERAIGSGLRPAVALPFPEDGLAVARPEQVDSLLPCSINFASALDLSSRCERIVRTLSFDIQNYPLVIGQMDSESRRKMRAKSDQLLPLIPSHMPFSELGISITLFLRLCAEGGPRMPEFGTLSALIRSVPALASVDPELLSLLSQDPDSVWALKKALDRTEYRYRGTTA